MTRGLTTSALDLSLLSVAAFQVSGIAVDATGRPVPGAVMTLLPASPTRTIMPVHGTAQADGTFRIVNVPGGTYRVSASMPMGRGGTDVSAAASAGAVGRQPPFPEVNVDYADVTGVQVTVRQRQEHRS